MARSTLLFRFCAIAVIEVAWASSPVVRTQYGDVEGFQYKLKDGRSADVFLGIPFASPPIGELRFRQPEPPAKWSDVKKTVEFPRACSQPGSAFPIPPAGQSEDCLYLNVFAPTKKRQDGTGYPVMVWIYGGGFQWGSTFDYGKVGICENFVARDVVVVIIQYRLSVYGFLSTGDSAAPGNWGLWDQVEALRWVKANIANFGGDPNRVTIFGESAGAASVSYMTLIPAARDLFQQSIAQSASAFGFWTRQYTPRQNAEKFASTYAGCAYDDTNKLVECLRAKTYEELDQAISAMVPDLRARMMLFVPTVDGILIPDVPQKLAETQLPKPAMLGSCKDEGLLFVHPPPRFVQKAATKGSVKALFSGDKRLTIEIFLGMINGTFSEALFPHSVDVARKLARFNYLDSRPQCDTNDDTFLQWQLSELLSDTMFNVPVFTDAIQKRKIGAPVYLYNFDFINRQFFPDDFKFKGVLHTADLIYEFGLEGTVQALIVDPAMADANDHKITDLFCTLLTNFAKYANPTPEPVDSVVWPLAEPSLETNALRIDLPLSVGSFRRCATAFWTDLLPAVERLMVQADHGVPKHNEL